jgi:hypothetical protein
MTQLTARTHHSAHLDQSNPPVPPLRRTLAVIAALFTLPYLVLKGLWLLGLPVGINDPIFFDSPAMFVLNLATFGFDIAALLLAGAFAFRSGMRVAPWLLLPPMWIGSGLLGQILIALPLTGVWSAVSPSAPAGSNPNANAALPIAEWVFAVVYTGFAGLGIFLLAAFALYARDRWSLRTAAPLSARSRTARLAAAAAALVAGLVHAALGTDAPLQQAVDLIMVGAAVLGLAWSAVEGPRLRGNHLPVIAAWLGTGAMAGWGAYHAVLNAFPTPLLAEPAIAWGDLTGDALRLVAGASGALVLVLTRTRTRRAG